MIACATCGRENPTGSRFCNSCGATLGGPAEYSRAADLYAGMGAATAAAEPACAPPNS